MGAKGNRAVGRTELALLRALPNSELRNLLKDEFRNWSESSQTLESKVRRSRHKKMIGFRTDLRFQSVRIHI